MRSAKAVGNGWLMNHSKPMSVRRRAPISLAKRNIRLALAAACLAVSACAPTADSIAPAYVDPAQFANLSCPQMTKEIALRDAELGRVSEQQDRAATNDAWGVALLGVPTASASGENNAGTIARYKGEQEALRDQMVRINCNATSAPPSQNPAP